MKKKCFLSIMLSCIFLFNGMFVALAGENWSLGQEADPSTISEALPVAKTVLGTLQWIGYLVAVAMLIWVGIRYLTSSVGEKVKAKESLLPMVIGAILVAGATWIASAVFNL